MLSMRPFLGLLPQQKPLKSIVGVYKIDICVNFDSRRARVDFGCHVCVHLALKTTPKSHIGTETFHFGPSWASNNALLVSMWPLSCQFWVVKSLSKASKHSPAASKRAPRRPQDEQDGPWDGLYKSFQTDLEGKQDTDLIGTMVHALSSQHFGISSEYTPSISHVIVSQFAIHRPWHVSQFHKSQLVVHNSMGTNEYSAQRRTTFHETSFTLSLQVSKQRKASL